MTMFVLSHPDGRLFLATGETAVEAVLTIDPDQSRVDEWVICDERPCGQPVDLNAMAAFFVKTNTPVDDIQRAIYHAKNFRG